MDKLSLICDQCGSVDIELIDENEVEELGNQKRVYNYTEGLKEFIKYISL